MADLTDPQVRELLEQPNYAVISTLNGNGSVHNTIVWISAEDGAVAVNSTKGRKWPTNLERNSNVTVLVYDASNPYNYVEIRGQAAATTDGADEHIDALARKYTGKEFQGRQPGEERIKFVIKPDHIRPQRQG